jgi:hypothetical protein
MKRDVRQYWPTLCEGCTIPYFGERIVVQGEATGPSQRSPFPSLIYNPKKRLGVRFGLRTFRQINRLVVPAPDSARKKIHPSLQAIETHGSIVPSSLIDS